MNTTRKYRLLLLATRPSTGGSFYAQYRQLEGEGLVKWVLGGAYLTDNGRRALQAMQQDRRNQAFRGKA